MSAYKHKIIGSLCLLGASLAHAEPSQIFGVEAAVPFLITEPLTTERQRFLSLFDNTVQSYGFENVNPGDSTPLPVLFNGSANNRITATLTGSGTTPSGQAQTVMGEGEVGRFNTTTGGQNYWRINASGTAEFSITFDRSISAFGFYGTDIGDFGGMLSLVLTPADTTLPLESLTIRPESQGSATNGLAMFYAFADATRAYSKITFVTSGTLSDGAAEDFFGFDDFIVADSGQFLTTPPTPPGVPEPGSLALVGLALFAAGYARKSRKAA
jgi:PEP-CTERM motif